MDKAEEFVPIVETLRSKSALKQQVYDNTLAAFEAIKGLIGEMSGQINLQIGEGDERIQLKYTDLGEFNAQLKVAGDLLVFNMHTNVFQFDRNHEIWKTKYIQDNEDAGFSGIISIYNFLADSFKYNRMEDLGYLIARIFINKDNHFFVQGKRQSGFGFSTMGDNQLDTKNLKAIVRAAVQYCLDFDLLVPPYDHVKLATVAQVHQNISDERLKTGKRLGFQFRSDDID